MVAKLGPQPILRAMDRLDRWAKHVDAVDSFMDEIGREFAQSSNRVHEAWLELAKAPTSEAALDRLVELGILLGITTKIQREDLAREVKRLYRLYPDDNEDDAEITADPISKPMGPDLVLGG